MPGPRIRVTLYSDPGCPWAYSVNPALRCLEWRYGEQLAWRLVLIGLAETSQDYVDRGYTPGGMAAGWTRYRRFGMPISPAVRPRVAGTARACRAVCAARSLRPGDEWTAFRALQTAWFTTDLVLDEDEAIHAVLAQAGLDAAAIVARLDAPDVTAAYEAGRAEARTAAGSPAELQGKTVRTDGPVRFSAPSVVLERDGVRLVAGGFQTVQAYDVLTVNLGAGLERRQPPADAAEALAAFPGGLTTQEVTALLVRGNDDPDRLAAEQALHALVADGRATRTPVGDDAVWRPAP